MLPFLARILSELGANIRAARLRRRLSTIQVAERAGITRQTLHAIEKGAPTVGMGNYAHVLMVLGLEKDLLQVAADDVLGRKLQDAELETRRRAPRRSRSKQ
jgi:transcriptional regulator with XRE-family HTH domain